MTNAVKNSKPFLKFKIFDFWPAYILKQADQISVRATRGLVVENKLSHRRDKGTGACLSWGAEANELQSLTKVNSKKFSHSVQ